MSSRRTLAGGGALIGALLLARALGLESSSPHGSVLSPLGPTLRVPTDSAASIELKPAQVAVEAPSASTAPDAEPRRPHPLTPAHQRIFRENELIGRLNAALDLEDVAELRRLNERYRAEYPEDTHQLQDAYALIAQCQEQRTDAARDKAQHFWSEHRSSTLRRYVRRYCLETES